MLFASKYGKEFVSGATELMPDCGVNRQLIELLSIRAPSSEKKLKLLKEIAEEHELDWDPAATETELFKPQEDLLNGPTQFVSGSKLPLPKEKHDETLTSVPDQAHHEQPDSDTRVEMLEFPEVPKMAIQPNINTLATPITPSLPAAPPPEVDHESLRQYGATQNLSQELHLEPEEVTQERSVANSEEIPQNSVSTKEDRQFVPFIAPPSLSPVSFSAKQSDPPVTVSRKKSETNVDLQDVLAAAHTAAESAERAAAAARSAASLAQIRISELTKKKNDEDSVGDSENPFHIDGPEQSATKEKPHLDQKNSLNDPDCVLYSPDSHQVHEGNRAHESSDLPSIDKLKFDFDSPPSNDQIFDQENVSHQPQRLPSMDDESYFSYPNLFASQNSNLGSVTHSFPDTSRSNNQV
ncbi:hypothetical protein Pint_07797 [Pistacia integerrima]|uniref:Uncharacterized protein n=1 Tax=Pistacia integerrima TaxID=434235 RepID=A0ACC0XRV3_9ROSI|nr:hypothetical protein Pint_07797 [Pistacia integerrima]